MDFKEIIPFAMAGFGVILSIVNTRNKAASVDAETRALFNKFVIELRTENESLREKVSSLEAAQVVSDRTIRELRAEVDSLRRQLNETNETVRKGGTGTLNPASLPTHPPA